MSNMVMTSLKRHILYTGNRFNELITRPALYNVIMTSNNGSYYNDSAFYDTKHTTFSFICTIQNEAYT